MQCFSEVHILYSCILADVGLGRPSGRLGGHDLEFGFTEVRTISGSLYILGLLSWTYLFWSRRLEDLSHRYRMF